LIEPRRVERCRVYVDMREQVPVGMIALPPSFFSSTEHEPGHHVVVSRDDRSFKVQCVEDELIREREIGLTPRLALVLQVTDGDIVEVEGRSTLGDEVFSDVEDFLDILSSGGERLLEFIEIDMERFIDATVGEALDILVKEKVKVRGGERDYLVVPPNPDGFGVDKEDVYPDRSKDVKLWSPDEDGDGQVETFTPDHDGDGKVRIFRPEPDDEDMDGG
jgi:hypothetical protein